MSTKFALWVHDDQKWHRRVADFTPSGVEIQSCAHMDACLKKMILTNPFLSEFDRMQTTEATEWWRINMTANPEDSIIVYMESRNNMYHIGIQLQHGWLPHDIVMCRDAELALNLSKFLMVAIGGHFHYDGSLNFYQHFVIALDEWSEDQGAF